MRCLFCFIAISLVASCAPKESQQSFPRTRKYKDYSCGIITRQKPIVWNSKESERMIMATKYKRPFLSLLPHYSAQQRLTTCGLASARIVLSSIYEDNDTPFPLDVETSNTEEKNGMTKGRFFLTERAVCDVYNGDDEDKQYDVIARLKRRKSGKFDGGIDLDKLTELMNLHPNVKAKHFVVSSAEAKYKDGLDIFRKRIKDIASTNGKYMIANYHIGAMFPYTTGHFSPVVAYYEPHDMVLIMDVAGNLGSWCWIKTEELYGAMNSVLNGNARGYIIVENAKVLDKKKTAKNV